MSTFVRPFRLLYRCTVATGFATAALVAGAILLASDADAQETLPPAPASRELPQDSTAVGQLPERLLHPQPQPGTLDSLHAPLLRRDLRIDSAQSCATSNCHGGPRPGVASATAARGSEFQLWQENDPHALSWRTICSDESVAMMRRLKILDGKRIIDRQGFDNCLACHNTAGRFDEVRADVFLREGVGCAACHGPSQEWATTHYRFGWSPDAATADGFVNAADLFVRARMCASCHVGDQDRDMNHDLIAAGHPTLRFELATYHAWQPKHWRDAQASDKTFFEAQLWLAGQVAATDASLALLASRAEDAHSVSQWPEFAAYNCASCHHHLALDREPSGTGRGTAQMSQWHDAGLRWLIAHRRASGESTGADDHLLESLRLVESAMQRRPRPSPDTVSQAAAGARRALAAWFEGSPGQFERNHFRSDRLAKVVETAANQSTFASWESATQFYLAAVAARESWPGGWDGPARPLADQMRGALRYPEMVDISRYPHRATAQGPGSNRQQITEWAQELAATINQRPRPSARLPLPYQTNLDAPSLDRQSAARLDSMLRTFASREAPTVALSANGGIDSRKVERRANARRGATPAPQDSRYNGRPTSARRPVSISATDAIDGLSSTQRWRGDLVSNGETDR